MTQLEDIVNALENDFDVEPAGGAGGGGGGGGKQKSKNAKKRAAKKKSAAKKAQAAAETGGVPVNCTANAELQAALDRWLGYCDRGDIAGLCPVFVPLDVSPEGAGESTAAAQSACRPPVHPLLPRVCL
jgi:hypothetical protein